MGVLVYTEEMEKNAELGEPLGVALDSVVKERVDWCSFYILNKKWCWLVKSNMHMY